MERVCTHFGRICGIFFQNTNTVENISKVIRNHSIRSINTLHSCRPRKALVLSEAHFSSGSVSPPFDSHITVHLTNDVQISFPKLEISACMPAPGKNIVLGGTPSRPHGPAFMRSGTLHMIFRINNLASLSIRCPS